jgi:hypothetical protein
MPPRLSSIAILVHARQKITFGAFLRRIVDDCWKPEGRRVTVNVPYARPVSAEAAIVHVDMTRPPPVFSEFAKLHPVALNADVRDISKRRVCTTLVDADDSYDGPVIVKTDLNHRGDSERRLGFALPDWSWILPETGYRTFDRKADVPARVWRDDGLVVQRLHVERAGDRYLLRQWFFLGDRDICSDYHGAEPVVKQANVVVRPPLHHEVPESLRRRRAELGFDYGKFDYVIENGEAVLIDANPTPDNGTRIGNDRCAIICRHLAPGIDSFAQG